MREPWVALSVAARIRARRSHLETRAAWSKTHVMLFAICGVCVGGGPFPECGASGQLNLQIVVFQDVVRSDVGGKDGRAEC
jgi:hypothetical protein